MHVGRFGLDDAHVDVLGVGEFVVVELAVLGAGAVHPDGALGFDEHAAAVEDVDLVVVGEVELVVGDPEPVVLEVDARLLRDVEEHEGAFAGGVDGGGDGGVLGAVVGLEVRAGGAADAHVDVPHARGALRRGSDVPFDEDGAGLGTFDLKDQVAHLDGAGLAGLADLEDWGWGGLVGERGARGHDDGPDLAGDLDVGGDFDGGRDDVGAVVEVDDLACLRTVEDFLDRRRVICYTIAFGSCGLDADEGRGGDGFVLWLGTLEDAVAVHEGGRLGWGGKGALNLTTCGRRSRGSARRAGRSAIVTCRIGIALNP